MENVIVSRHPAAIEFIRAASVDFADARVIAQATADDVRGKVVAGNLPLHLAAVTAEVVAVEFAGPPPRGLEYTLADMQAAGAKLARYRVSALPAVTADTRPVAVAESWESIALDAARKVATNGKARPLVGVVASHSASHWRGDSTTPDMPTGFDPEAPTVLLDGGMNGKRPLYLVDGRAIARGSHFGLQSSFGIVKGAIPEETPGAQEYVDAQNFRPIAQRLLPAVEYLRAKVRMEKPTA
jgi:hypothetical protein